MAVKSILNAFGKVKVDIFTKDFLQLMRVADGMDNYWGRGRTEVDKLMPQYEKLISAFKKKYPGLDLRIEKTVDELVLHIYLKTEETLQDFFTKVASKISGIKSFGAGDFDTTLVSNQQEVSAELANVQDKIYIAYHESGTGSNTVILTSDEKKKRVEVNYNFEGAMNERSPTFQIVGFYALQKGFDTSIEVFEKGALGFFDMLSEHGKKEWLGRFNPLQHE